MIYTTQLPTVSAQLEPHSWLEPHPFETLTLSGPEDFDRPKGRGGKNLPAGKRWSLMASEATAEAKKRKNIVPDIFLYL